MQSHSTFVLRAGMFLSLFLLLCSGVACVANISDELEVDQTDDALALPASLRGRLVWHRSRFIAPPDFRTSTEAQLFTYNFKTGVIANLSANWNSVTEPMNADWNRAGSAIVFHGRPKVNGLRLDDWDVFLYAFDGKEPRNLTRGSGRVEQDAKFSPDGSKIIFKVHRWNSGQLETGGIAQMNTPTPLATGAVTSKDLIVPRVGAPERSMPVFSTNAKGVADGIWFSGRVGAATTEYIGKATLTGAISSVAVVDTPNKQDFYPKPDGAGNLLWTSARTGTVNTAHVWRLAGAMRVEMFPKVTDDMADPATTNTSILFWSQMAPGTNNQTWTFDISYGDMRTGVSAVSADALRGKLQSKTLHDLGPCYTPVGI